MANLANCEAQDLESLTTRLFSSLSAYPSVEEAAKTLVKTMCNEYRSGKDSDIVLSRVFHSFEYGLLPPDLQEAGAATLGATPGDDSKFLVLLGTHGDKPEWQDRNRSVGHKAIPLNRKTVTTIPMVARLFQQVGFDLGIVLGEKQKDSEMGMGGVTGSYGIFHVATAPGSPFIPAQDFVIANGVKSVVGTGVMLPEGDIGVYLAFCRVPISEKVAANFAALMSLFWQRIFPLRDKGMFT